MRELYKTWTVPGKWCSDEDNSLPMNASLASDAGLRATKSVFTFCVQLWSATYFCRVRLSKRRKIGASGATTTNSRLIVKHRPLNEVEVSAQVRNLKEGAKDTKSIDCSFCWYAGNPKELGGGQHERFCGTGTSGDLRGRKGQLIQSRWCRHCHHQHKTKTKKTNTAPPPLHSARTSSPCCNSHGVEVIRSLHGRST